MSLPLRHPIFARELTPTELVDWYRAARERSRQLFAIPRSDCYYERPIALRNPIVFYEGHLPAFAVNTLIKGGLGRAGLDATLEVLFARGIDPADVDSARPPTDVWPSRSEVLAYAKAADAVVERALMEGACPLDYVFTIIEHELMHQETLLYMFHEMPYEQKVRPAGLGAEDRNATAPQNVRSEAVRIPAGRATLGAQTGWFGWDNEFPAATVEVDAFAIDSHNVTNADYLEFMHATGAPAPHFWIRKDARWFWRGMFELIPLPLTAPVYVMHDEAAAYARWKGKRLPTEAEYHRAAFGSPSGGERLYPWGDEPPGVSHGNFDFRSFDLLPVGSSPAGASAWGVHDLVGNGWEWTSTLFAGFPGFAPMRSYPQYSADFFDSAHYVMKGASPATARELVRRSFRNWFRPNYPYVYATFRCVA